MVGIQLSDENPEIDSFIVTLKFYVLKSKKKATAPTPSPNPLFQYLFVSICRNPTLFQKYTTHAKPFHLFLGQFMQHKKYFKDKYITNRKVCSVVKIKNKKK